MLGAYQAGTSLSDIYDDSDEGTQFVNSGFMEPLDDLLPNDFWDDWPPEMMSMVKIWDQYKGEPIEYITITKLSILSTERIFLMKRIESR